MGVMSLALPFDTSEALNVEHLADPNLTSTAPSCGVKYPPDHSANCQKFIIHIPNAPTTGLRPDVVQDFLFHELSTPLLDKLNPKLWSVTSRCGSHIDSLNESILKGRAITACEDAQLHLLFYHDRIFIKPVPVCLFNHQFWSTYLDEDIGHQRSHADTPADDRGVKKDISHFWSRQHALGYLRSYSFLVRHPLDFKIAQEHNLLPASLDWICFLKFINTFRSIDDTAVAKRYHFGQIRISRLNWLVRLTQPNLAPSVWFYHIPHWSIEVYLKKCTTPFFFGFACISLALSAMQVILSLPLEHIYTFAISEAGLRAICAGFWALSIGVLITFILVWILIIIVPTSVLVWQLAFGVIKYRVRGPDYSCKRCIHMNRSRKSSDFSSSKLV